MEVENICHLVDNRPLMDHGVWTASVCTSRGLNRWSGALRRRTNRFRKLAIVHLLVRLVWPDRCILKSSSLSNYGNGLKIPDGSTTSTSLGACGSLLSVMYALPCVRYFDVEY